MKKITFLVLLISFSVFSQEHESLFIKIDSIQSNNPNLYLFRIIDMLNFEYNNSNITNKNDREIITTLRINSNKKFDIININKANDDIKDSLQNWLLKAPQIPVENFIKSEEFDFVTLKFDLKVIDYKGVSFEKIIELKTSIQEKINSITELDMYPSFGKKKSKYSDKDKAAKNLNIFLNDFIREKFIYPNYALENNIQGKTLISFVINKEGDVRSIISYSGHPILQLQSIKMFETLPKFNPGERNNKSVNVKFTMPITYRLQN